MNDIFELLSMGAYNAYVWSAYGFALLILVSNVLITKRQSKALLK